MRRQPLGLLVTFAFVAVAKVAPSSALGHGERDDSSVWPSRNKEEERIDPVAVFKTLRLHKVKDQPQLFKNQWFHGWVRYMKLHHREDPEKAMLLTLNNVFDDQKVAAMIIEAKQVSKTKKLATELQEAQLQIWKSQTKSPDDVFAYLQLSKLMEDQVENPWTLFESPRFDMWTAYLEKFGNEIDVNEVIVQTLTTHSTDQAVAEMIMEAKQVSKTEAIATKLQEAQLQIWKSQSKSPDDVFALLQLSNFNYGLVQGRSTLFEGPMFDMWKAYLEKFGNEIDVNEVIVKTLTTHFNDHLVAEIIMEAKKVSKTETIATELQEAQLQIWKSQSKSPDDVFALFQLSNLIYGRVRGRLTFLESPRFDLWKTYLEKFGNEIDVNEVIVQTLTTHSNDQIVAEMIMEANKVGKSRAIALKLQEKQLQIWKSQSKSPDDIFALLQLSPLIDRRVQDRLTLFESPRFDMWKTYLEKFGNEIDVNKVIVQTLTTHSTDQAVAEMIMEAKQVSKTEAIATKLQEAQLQVWKSQSKSPDDVFALLQLNNLINGRVQGRLIVFESPRFDMWTAYLEKFGNEIDVNEVIVQTLTTHYNDLAVAILIMEAKQVSKTEAIATKLQEAQLQVWKSQSKSPDDVFALLQLSKLIDEQVEDRSTLFKSPRFDIWKTYLEMTLKKEDVNKVIVQTLTTHFNDQVVAAIIIESKQVSETEAISTELQKAQLQLWKSQNKSPNDVYALVQVRKHIDDQARDLLTLYKSPRFGMWKTYLEMTLEEEIYVIEVIRENLLTHYPANRLLDLLTTTLFKAEKHSSEKQLTLNLFKAQLWSRYFNGRISNLARK